MDRKSRFAIRRFTSLDEMKAEEYEYWQQQPAQKRMEAVDEITREAFGLKGRSGDEPRLQRTLSVVKR